MTGQIVSLAAAAMILGAFAAQQAGKLDPKNLVYLSLNLVGSVMLTYFALEARQLGLTVMEAAWAVISLVSLVRRGTRPAKS